MSNWRDLARQGVVFDQWPLDAKLQDVEVILPAGAIPAGGDLKFELFGSLGQVELKRFPVNSGSAESPPDNE